MCGLLFHNIGHKIGLKASNNALKTLVHRGPDAMEFKEYYDEKKLYLGHVRLSILDQDGGRQPYETDDFIMVFNGEIYNHLSLRKELENKGAVFQSSHSDTETLIKGFEYEGKTFFKKIQGMFAVVIYDKKTKIIYAARDHMGIKPLYYYMSETDLVFSSEIKTILAIFKTMRKKPTIRSGAISEYFCFRAPVFGTMFEGIKKLKPSHFYRFQNGNIIADKFDPYVGSESTQKNFLEKEVKQQLISDVDVGLLLSGGVDSSLISILAKKNSFGNVTAFCLSAGGELDETKYAKDVAQKFGINLQVVKMDTSNFKNSFAKWAKFNDDPISDPSSVALFHLCEKINKCGIKVLLSGEGADELFLGYNSHTKYFIAKRMERFGLAGIAAKFLPLNFINKKAVFWGTGMYASPEFITQVCGVKDIPKIQNKMMMHSNNKSSNADYIRFVEIQYRLPNDLLMRGDRVSMAHSIELRVPFLGEAVAKYSKPLGVRALKGYMYFGSKLPLKSYLEKFMPKPFVRRKKIGFELPLINIVMKQFSHEIDIFLNEQKITGLDYAFIGTITSFDKSIQEHIAFIWSWLVLEFWYREFCE